MRRRYVTALAIVGAYFIASYLILHGAILAQRSISRAVVMSGQQRMYSQRIAMFADSMVARPNAELKKIARADLGKSIALFAQQHRALSTGDASVNPSGWPPASVRELYFKSPYEVDKHVREYLAHARAVEDHAAKGLRPGDPDLEYLLAVGPGPLLNSLDAVVQQYSLEQRKSIQKFEYLQLGLLFLGLSTLVIVWFTILRPLEIEIASKTAELLLTATQDPLTGLLNRKAFTERVEHSIQHAKRQHEAGAMLMIDLDHLKTINDTYGHLAGDRALIRTAEILKASVRACDYVTRLGGDEFAVFAPVIDMPNGLHSFVERMCEALQFDITTDANTTITVNGSVGVARSPHDGETIDELLRNSDLALYAAKFAGRGTFRFFAIDATRANV